MFKIVDDKKEWTKLQGLKGNLTVVQRKKLSRLQMTYSAKYNARWEKSRLHKKAEREKAEKEEAKRQNDQQKQQGDIKLQIKSMEIDSGEKKEPMGSVMV